MTEAETEHWAGTSSDSGSECCQSQHPLQTILISAHFIHNMLKVTGQGSRYQEMRLIRKYLKVQTRSALGFLMIHENIFAQFILVFRVMLKQSCTKPRKQNV